MAKRGGGIFSNVDPLTGATKLTSLSIVLIFLLVVGIVLAIVLPLVLSKKHDEPDREPERHKVGPNMNKIPGAVDIVSVSQAPSAGQAIIYFSKHEAEKTTCDSCEVEFSVNITYTGGSLVPSPTPTIITAPLNSGTAILTYGWPDSHTQTPPIPTPPTSVTLDITARVIDPANPTNKGRPTSFSKTLPYVA